MADKRAPRKHKQTRARARASLGDLLSYAAFLCDSQRLEELIRRADKKLPRLVDSTGRTALHVSASVAEGREMTKWLLENSGVEIERADSESLWTALHRSVYHGNVSAAISLIKVALHDLKQFQASMVDSVMFSAWSQCLPGRQRRTDSPRSIRLQ